MPTTLDLVIQPIPFTGDGMRQAGSEKIDGLSSTIGQMEAIPGSWCLQYVHTLKSPGYKWGTKLESGQQPFPRDDYIYGATSPLHTALGVKKNLETKAYEPFSSLSLISQELGAPPFNYGIHSGGIASGR
jgi:hypothetical protein